MDTRNARPNDSSLSNALAAPSARLPISVLMIWVCAFAGLAAYTASWFMPAFIH